MKKVITLVGVLAVGLSAYGQGTILFQNVGPGLSANVLLPGGSPVPSGNAYTVELLAGATAGALAPVAGTTGFAAPGLFLGGTKTLTGLAGGAFPFLQVRVWENKGGTVTSFAQAQSSGAQYGSSAAWQLPVSSGGLGNPTGNPPTPAPPLAGMTGFTLVPEPSTYALLALGAAALFIRRRK